MAHHAADRNHAAAPGMDAWLFSARSEPGSEELPEIRIAMYNFRLRLSARRIHERTLSRKRQVPKTRLEQKPELGYGLSPYKCGFPLELGSAQWEQSNASENLESYRRQMPGGFSCLANGVVRHLV